MPSPDFDHLATLERVQQLRAEAAVARRLRELPSWRQRLAAALVRLALRCEPGVLQFGPWAQRPTPRA